MDTKYFTFVNISLICYFQAQNKGFDGPILGPKMSEENKRNFTEEENRAARDGHISLQAGQNKGATQAGISMGKGRKIMDWTTSQVMRSLIHKETHAWVRLYVADKVLAFYSGIVNK